MNLDIYLYKVITEAVFSGAPQQAVAVIAASLLIWVLVTWYIVTAIVGKKSGPAEIFALALGGGMVYLFNIMVTFGWWRPRPFIMMDITPLIDVSAASKSFPSDHASLAFFIAFLLSQYRKKWWWAYLLAVAVALGRVAVGVHYPLDILAGAIVGLAFGYLTVQVEKLFSQTKI